MMNRKLLKVSIILPCYNPPADWAKTLIGNVDKLSRELPDCQLQFVVAGDGSKKMDNEAITEATSLPEVVFLNWPVNEGKGAVIRKAMRFAMGSILIYTDIDFPFGTEPIKDMIRIFRQDPACMFIQGSRNGDYFKKLPVKRRMCLKALNMVNRILVNPEMADTQAGIKAMRREVLPELMQTQTKSFVFEIELLRRLIAKGFRIVKINVSARESMVFTNFSTHMLFKEAVNLARIIFGAIAAYGNPEL